MNGKKNGKGKEYTYNFWGNNPILLFEGEYMNNSRIRGKEFYKNGKLKFEGEYLFKNKLKGKFFDFNGSVIFKLNNKNNEKIEEMDDELRIIIIKMNWYLKENI